MKHHPWDDNALAPLREAIHQKTIKAACGSRVRVRDVAATEAEVDCAECRTWLAGRDRGLALIQADAAQRAAKACTCSGGETGAEHLESCPLYVEPPPKRLCEYDFGVRAVQLLSQVFGEVKVHYTPNSDVEDGHVEVDRMLGVTWGDDFGPFEVYLVTHWPGGEADDVSTIGEPHQRFDAAVCALARELATLRITHFQDREADAEAAEAMEAAKAEKGRNRW